MMGLDGVIPGVSETLVVASSHGDDQTLTLFLFAVGLYLVYDGFGRWKTKRLIEDTPTETVRSVAAGRTELEGVAKPYQETLPTPFTDDECLYVEWNVERKRSLVSGLVPSLVMYRLILNPFGTIRGARNLLAALLDGDRTVRGQLRWRSLATDSQSVPFYLDDGTGRVLVRADEGDPDCEISSENRTRVEVGSAEETPERIQRFIDAHDSQSETPMGSDSGQSGSSLGSNVSVQFGTYVGEQTLDGGEDEHRRYTQSLVTADTEVYVLGSALEREDARMEGAQEHLVEVTRDEELDTFLISDRGEAGLESYYEKWGPLEMLGGLALSAYCLLVLLT